MSVVVEKLSKRFVAGSMAAASDVSFEAPSGSITALLGPSGSGKTTVLRMIAGLERPDAGRVLLDGSDVTDEPARRRGVGFVFQGYALFQHMTVRENIAFGLRVRRAPRKEREQRVEELLAMVQLDGLGDRRPAQLSGGQQQRVAFARALAPRPRVLLLDEPFGALDARVRLELREWLLRLHHDMKLTTLLVTHDQEEALELSHRVVLMQLGKVEQMGAPHDLYDAPATAFVASFLGAASVLRGRVEGGRATVGALTVDAPHGAAEGSEVRAFVRPHDVRLRPSTDGKGAQGPAVSLARVAKLVRVGGYVKLELKLPTDETMSVQLSLAELEALRITEGDRVMVDLVGAKVFVEDYSI